MRCTAQGLSQAADLLKLLGNSSRLSIVRRLVEGECTLAVLEAELGIRQPSLSQQLAELRKARVVSDRRVAKSVHYALSDESREKITAILGALDGEEEICMRRRPTPIHSLARSVHLPRFGRIIE